MATIEKAVMLPFQIGINGSVATTTDQGKIWQDRVLSVLGTAVGERVQRYYFGSKVHQEIFVNVPEAISGIEVEISKAFSTHLPRLSLERVDSVYNEKEGTLSITVGYNLPNNDPQIISLGSVSIAGNLPIREN